MAKVFIRTPATTANVGPGFDCLGIALQLYNRLEASWEGAVVSENFSLLELGEKLESKTKVVLLGASENGLSQGEMGLFFQVLAKSLLLPDGSCLVPSGLNLRVDNEIPVAKGLGSSAACIVSALCLGREILKKAGQGLDTEELLAEAIRFDHYPDNVLPAFLGGGRLNVGSAGKLPLTFSLDIPEELTFVLALPELEIRSAEARQVLPQTFTLEEAVQNSALLGALMLALRKKDWGQLGELVQSPLHVPYRSKLIPGYEEVEKAARAQGALAFTISGSGPTVLALAVENCLEIGSAMVAAFQGKGIKARYFASKVDREGVFVEFQD